MSARSSRFLVLVLLLSRLFFPCVTSMSSGAASIALTIYSEYYYKVSTKYSISQLECNLIFIILL